MTSNTRVTLLFLLSVLIHVTTSTRHGAILAELENSIIAYTDHGDDIWNALMDMLPVQCVTDEILLGRTVMTMSAALKSHKTVCQALGVALGAVAGSRGFMTPREITAQVERCKNTLLPGARGREYISGTSTLMSGVRVAHTIIGNAVRPLTLEEEITRAANINIMSAMNSDSEAVMRFDGNYEAGGLAQRATAAAINISLVKRKLRDNV